MLAKVDINDAGSHKMSLYAYNYNVLYILNSMAGSSRH